MTTKTRPAPDYIINPTYPCSCTIRINGKVLSIEYCSVHKAAPELLKALKEMLYAYAPYRNENAPERLHSAVRNAGNAIAKAEGAL